MTHEIIVHADPLFFVFFGGGTGERAGEGMVMGLVLGG